MTDRPERCAKCGEPTDPWVDGDGGVERCRCPAPRDEAPATHEPGVVGACEILEALQSLDAASATGREAGAEDVPGAAEFREAFKKAAPPRGADLASWVNGYCAGWTACYAALRRGGEG